MKRKQLIIPIITPLRYVKGNDYVTEMCEPTTKYLHSEVYVCSTTLNNLKKVIGDHYDYVVPAMSTGEGDYLDFELWKSVTDISLRIFKESEKKPKRKTSVITPNLAPGKSLKDPDKKSKVIPAILKTDENFVREAVSYLVSRRDIDNVFLSITPGSIKSSFTESIISENKSLKFSLYLRYDSDLPPDKIVSNPEIISFIKRHKSRIELIKDSRYENSAKEINKLVAEIKKYNVKVFQGWENLYLDTDSGCSGGAFPLANIEPKIIYSFVTNDQKKESLKPTVDRLCERFNTPKNWIQLVKNEFFSKPINLEYQSRDFYKAIDKFFKIYSEEKLENFHVAQFDINNPCFSICRTLFSDLLAFQTIYFKNNSLGKSGESQFLFFPVAIAVVDTENRKGFRYVLRKHKKLDLQVTLSELSKELFTNYCDIEDKIFHHNLIGELINDTDNRREDYDSFPNIEKYFDRKKFIHKDSPNDKHLFRKEHRIKEEIINYDSEDGKDKIKIAIYYYVHNRLFAEIPRSVFEFLSRIAIFTKRNRMSVDNIKRQATRAAISQVMARNMSHNIGSHVLSKFKDKDDICNSVLNQYDGEGYNSLYNNKELRLKNQIAYFNDYLKNRMDFLADIATSDPVMENPMMLKEEVIKGFDRNRILLNRISGVSDNELKFKIVLTKEGADWTQDLSVSMTNDILGTQALYIFLENVIRNIAKHGKATQKERKNIVITIDVKDFEYNKSYYEISIFDNLAREYEEIEKFVVKRNDSFNQTIIDEKTDNLRGTNLGTIEMDVCAAYLRCLPIISIEDDKYALKFCGGKEIDEREHGKSHREKGEVTNNEPSNPKLLFEPKLLFAYKQPHSEKGKFSLGYKLFISKPKEVLVIDEENTFTDVLQDNDLINHGILVLNKISDEIKENKIFNQQILYYHSGGKFDPKSEANLPKRVVEKIEAAEFTDAEDFIRQVWEKYAVTNFLRESSIKIINENNFVVFGAEGNKIREIDKDDLAKEIYIANHNTGWYPDDKHVTNEDFLNYEGPDCFYYDMSCSHSKVSKYTTALTDYHLENNDVIIKAQYLEAVFCRVMIIDERIQENIVLNNKPYSGVGGDTNFYQYFKKQNVIIPTREQANLNDITFGNLDNKKSVSFKIKKIISDDIKAGNKKTQKETDFFVIHLGILEKMMEAGTDKDDKTKGTNAIIEELFPGDSRRKIIITSGRGKPDNLPADLPFVPFAMIQNAVETVFDKFVLTKILYNSRKTISR